MQVWKKQCVSEPSGLRFAFLWSPPCSLAQYSSRERKNSRNLESRTQNPTSGFLCAVRPQLPHTAAGRRFTDGFQGPERPLSVTSPLLLSLFLSVCVRHKQTLWDGQAKRNDLRTVFWQATALVTNSQLRAPAAGCLTFVSKHESLFSSLNSKYYSNMRHWTSANSFDGSLARMWTNALLHITVKYVELCWKPNPPTVTLIRLRLIWNN